MSPSRHQALTMAGSLWCKASPHPSWPVFHPGITRRFERLAQRADGMPHMVLHGPSGGGKHHLVRGFLHALTPACDQVSPVQCQIPAQRSSPHEQDSTQDVVVNASRVHLELDGRSLQHNKDLAHALIHIFAATKAISSPLPFRSESCGGICASFVRLFHHPAVVVVWNAGQLSQATQAALRRPLETLSESCKFILCCSSLTRIIDPIRSRCLAVRVPLPARECIRECLGLLVAQHSLPKEAPVNTILSLCHRNLTVASCMLQEWSVSRALRAMHWHQALFRVAQSLLQFQVRACV